MTRRSHAIKPPASPSQFVLLDDAQQRAAVCRLFDSRLSDEAIAQITGLAVDVVRRWLAERTAELRGNGEVIA